MRSSSGYEVCVGSEIGEASLVLPIGVVGTILRVGSFTLSDGRECGEAIRWRFDGGTASVRLWGAKGG